MKKLAFVFILLSIFSCYKKDPVNEEVFEPDPTKRARAYADRGGGSLAILIIKNHLEQILNLRAQMFFGEQH